MQPLLVYGGETKDGRKRERLCSELGISIEIRHLHTLTELCTALWATHPERAVYEAQTRNVLELAALCNTTPSAVALVLRRLNPRPLAKSNPIYRARPKTPGMVVAGKKVLLYMEPQLKQAIQKAGLKCKRPLNLSEAIRVASWEWVQRKLGGHAPTEGKRSGPSVEHVRPRGRRGGGI